MAKAGVKKTGVKEVSNDTLSLEEKVDAKWQAAFRATILSSAVHRIYNLIGTVDQKAQGLIFLNSVIIPVAISRIDEPVFQVGAVIAIVTAVLSILASIICIYPKRRGGAKPDGSINLFHFGDIGRMKEDEYLAAFMPVFNDTSRLSEEAAKDFHDISRRIMMPKMRWIKFAYICFFIGNSVALTITVLKLLAA